MRPYPKRHLCPSRRLYPSHHRNRRDHRRSHHRDPSCHRRPWHHLYRHHRRCPSWHLCRLRRRDPLHPLYHRRHRYPSHRPLPRRLRYRRPHRVVILLVRHETPLHRIVRGTVRRAFLTIRRESAGAAPPKNYSEISPHSGETSAGSAVTIFALSRPLSGHEQV